MIELPEAIVLAKQMNQQLTGKCIARATANASPHKFAWYSGDPAGYNQKLAGKTIDSAAGIAGNVEVKVSDMKMLLSAPLRFHPKGEKLPAKHQLLLEFTDGSALSCTIQMWGGMFCVKEGEKIGFEDYERARQQPSPLDMTFDRAFFDSLFGDDAAAVGKLSAKEFLATKQRIPGLGNGVLQDILWTAKIHPRRKMATLSKAEVDQMFQAIKLVLKEMTDKGGRDTERDLFGHFGGYKTVLSKNTVDQPCLVCGTVIKKEAFMGGSIYYCAGCQPL
jgi:formamidopyrimidine-DNA glycosylase